MLYFDLRFARIITKVGLTAWKRVLIDTGGVDATCTHY